MKSKGFTTSYIRPVHISYFCKENIISLINEFGFELITYNEENELIIA